MNSKYDIGDRVLISREWSDAALAIVNSNGRMDKYMGTVMTIRGYSGEYYKMEEDQGDENRIGGWLWDDVMIDGPADDNSSSVDLDHLDNIIF